MEITSKMKPEKIRKLQYLLVFAISFLVYFNSLFNQFALDDTLVLTDNKYTQQGFEGIKKIFTTDAFEGFYGESKNLLPGGRYRPLAQVLLNIEFTVFGMHPMPYHLVNVLLFSLLMMLLLKVLNLLLSTKSNAKDIFTIPFITTLIIAVHPIHTEVVANIKSIDLIMAFAFALMLIYQSMRYIETQKSIDLILIFLWFFLGILSKENVLTFIFALPLILLFFSKPSTKNWIAISAILGFGLLTYAALRFSFLGIPAKVEITELLNDPFLEASVMQRYATIFYTWFIYLKLLLVPHPLTHDYYPYAIELQSFTNPKVLVGLFIFIVGGFWSLIKLIRSLKKKEAFSVHAFGILFFLLVFSVSSNFMVNIGAFMNERFVFIADLGLILSFVFLVLHDIPKRFSYIKIKQIKIFFIALILVFSVKTISRNTVWYDDYTLFTTDAKTSVNSAKCNVSAGGKSYEKSLVTLDINAKSKLLVDAENFLIQGIKIHPKYTQAYWLLGNVYFEESKLEEAFRTYQSALTLSVGNVNIISNIRNLGLKAKLEKKDNIAIEIFTFLSSYNYQPEYPYQIADVYVSQNKFDTAIYILNKIIQIDTSYEEAYNKLGEIYGRFLQNLPKSEQYLIKASQINPKNASVLENLGVLNASLSRFDKAELYFKKSLELKPNNKQLLSNLALLYKNIGNIEKAQEYTNKANAIQN